MAYHSINGIKISGLAAAVPPLWEDQKDKIRRAQESQTTSDLGYEAAKTILSAQKIDPGQIGFVVFISGTPDYRSPATATVLHYRLNLSTDCIAYDMNIGGAGFPYGLQVGCSLLGSINKDYGLILLGDTVSKQLDRKNPLSAMYGDGAAAILLEKDTNAQPLTINSGAIGQDYKTIIHPGGGFRLDNLRPENMTGETEEWSLYNQMHINYDRMNEFLVKENSAFTMAFLQNKRYGITQFDAVVINHTTDEIKTQVARILDADETRFFSTVEKYGYTSGSFIPLTLADRYGETGDKEVHILAVGFGEGLSWGIVDFYIVAKDIFPVIETDSFFQEGAVSHNF